MRSPPARRRARGGTTRRWIAALGVAASLAMPSGPAAAAHGIAMHGQPALPPDFGHLPYAEPAAPVGGRATMAAIGSFDSLNPFV
ncbi:MAG: ABC transporter substrate-binding protein, partial [Alphaproteobacteria bacterium]